MLRLLAMLAVLIGAAPVAAQDDLDDDPTDAQVGVMGGLRPARPNPEAGPTRVTVGLYIIDISKIDDVAQSMTADFAVRVSWNDPRLATVEPGRRTLRLQDVWFPRLVIINKRRIWKTWPDIVEVNQQGDVMYRQRYFGTLTARLDLHDFPFDHNQIKIEFVETDHRPSEIELIRDEEITGRAEQFSLVDSRITGGTIEPGTYFFAPAGVDLPALIFTADIQRYSAYYLWKIILPLTIIVCMSWLVFWINPKQFGPQIGLAATAVLTLIAYRFLLGSLIPRVSYLTRLDIFIMGATVLVFLGMVEAVVSARVAERNEQGARRLNRFARVGFPAAFIVVTYVAFFA